MDNTRMAEGQETAQTGKALAQRSAAWEPPSPAKFGWIDVLWLVLLVGLAVLPPVREIHKQLTLLAIGVFQIFEGRLIAWQPSRGRFYSVLIKILLSTLLLGHTGVVGINSDYYPIFFVPVVTAAIYFGTAATLAWTAFASLAYCSYLIQAIVIEDYESSPTGFGILGRSSAIRRFPRRSRNRIRSCDTRKPKCAEPSALLRLASLPQAWHTKFAIRWASSKARRNC